MTFDEDASGRARRLDHRARRAPADPRPTDRGFRRYQLVAGERRWRAARDRGPGRDPGDHRGASTTRPPSRSRIIENLQREDLSPLDEAMMYERMTHEHGYSVRRLAQKLGKDKGYIENRLRLAGAPTEIKQLVSLRKDTLSHAYELLKVEDPKKRRRLAEQVASGELSLVKLREKIEGKPHVVREPSAAGSGVEEIIDGADVEELGARADAAVGYRAR